MPATRSKLIALCALTLSAAAACSSGGTTTANSSPPASSTAAASSMVAMPDKAAGCDAVLKLNASQPPGSDPDGPAATPQQVKDWAAQIDPVLTTASQNAPSNLAGSFAVLQTALAGAKQGTSISGDDATINTALNTINASMFDNCDYQTVDVVNENGKLTGAPTTLKAGPTVVKYTNSTDPATAGFVLLFARVKDGQTAPLADIESGKLDITTVADVLAGAQPMGADPGYAAADLPAGHYVLLSPLGTPPSFTGTIGAEFDVQ
jgi:hypothetical protein